MFGIIVFNKKFKKFHLFLPFILPKLILGNFDFSKKKIITFPLSQFLVKFFRKKSIFFSFFVKFVIFWIFFFFLWTYIQKQHFMGYRVIIGTDHQEQRKNRIILPNKNNLSQWTRNVKYLIPFGVVFLYHDCFFGKTKRITRYITPDTISLTTHQTHFMLKKYFLKTKVIINCEIVYSIRKEE